LGARRGACDCTRNRWGAGLKLERNEASRGPCHCDHAGCTASATGASATGARRQTFGSRGRCSCGRARGGDHRETHTWRSRPG
jgi:hypothetical protein